MSKWNNMKKLGIVLISLLVIAMLFYYGVMFLPKNETAPSYSGPIPLNNTNNDLNITNISVSGVKSVESTISADISSTGKAYKYNYLEGNLILKFNKQPTENKNLKYIVEYYMDNTLIKSQIGDLSYLYSGNLIGNEYQTTINYEGAVGEEINKVIVYNADRSISSEYTFDTIKFFSTE